jgi:HEAT repeat protein
MFAWFRRWRLRRQAGSTDPATRQQRPDGEAAGILIPFLCDTHTPVRDAARTALGQLGARALQPLIEALNHADANLAAASADVLGEIGDASAIEPLITSLKFAPRPVQLAAMRALEQLGPPALEPLREVRNDPSPYVRQKAEEILAKLEPSRAQRKVEEPPEA